MNGDKRREEVLRILSNAKSAVNATKLAEEFGVTRQIIVADVALLRAAGNPIRAEHRGYVLDKQDGSLRKSIVCRHSGEGVTDEFYTIIDNGGKIIDVQVEHSIYGIISADLSISSRYEADEFVNKVRNTGAAQLSDLTGGVHIHTISVKDEDAYERICKKLAELNILIND